MKVISIRQPWASLIAKGYKKYEFRSWATKYRGDIFIHASKSVEKDKLERFKHLNINECPTGKIIAKANLLDCIKVNKLFEDNLIEKDETVYGATRGREGYAFKLGNIQEIEPIEAKGQLGIWNYDGKERIHISK